jgi:hypothetical protein
MTANSHRRRRLPEQVAQAMTEILDYLWQEEAQDYLSRSREDQKGHIFNEMLTVRNWLTPRRQIKGWNHVE